MGEMLLHLDGAILMWIQEYIRCPVLTVLMCFVSALGNGGLVWIAVSLGLLIPKRTRKLGVLTLISLLLGALCTNVILKPLIARPRPWLVVEGLSTLVTENDPASFPSGHTCAAFAACCVWMHALPRKWRILPLAAGALMGISRLYVGVHFPTDVLAGAVIGAACAYLVWHSRGGRREANT